MNCGNLSYNFETHHLFVDPMAPLLCGGYKLDAMPSCLYLGFYVVSNFYCDIDIDYGVMLQIIFAYKFI